MGHMMDTDLDPTQMLEVRVISFLIICTSLSFFFRSGHTMMKTRCLQNPQMP